MNALHTAVVTLATLLAAQALAVAALPSREVTLLDGTWKRAFTPAAAEAPPAEGWTDFEVPGAMQMDPKGGSRSAWFTRQITAPTDLSGRRVFIDLRAARFEPSVYVDGKLAGKGSDGWSPSVVEITPLLKPSATHTLTVRINDYGVYFADGFVKTESGESQMRGKVLAPIGGFKVNSTISDHVRLRVTADRFIDADDLRIVTSTRKGTLGVAGSVRHARPGARVAVRVLDGDVTALTPPPAAVNADGSFEVTAAFPNARRWSPEDPHRYTLRLTLLEADTAVDVLDTRFGFKEVWTEGPDFYLNGVKRRLLASSTWPVMEFEDPGVIRAKVANILASNTIAFRTHIGPWQEAWTDAADELGLLMIPEAAVYTDGTGFYAYDDERFWANYRRHIEGMIRRDRNRPSVVLWSLGNEILFMGNAGRAKDLPRKLGDLARFARTVDPTRPYTYEADLDPDGAYDIVGLHYPHEMPAQRAYPNTADWLDRRKDTEAGGGMLGQQGTGGFLWDRAKPLYIGEYLWTPHGDYSNSTIWFGDDAFLHRSSYHDRARLLAWRDQTLAYRRAGVTGTCPWTAFGFGGVAGPLDAGYLAQKEFYKPRAAYLRTRGLRFFAGSDARLTFDVFNDSAGVADYELALAPLSGSAVPASSVRLRLDPADHRELGLDLKLPPGMPSGEHRFEVVLRDAGRIVDRTDHVLQVFARAPISAPPGTKLVVLDPTGKWPGAVASLPADLDPARTVVLVSENVVPPQSATPVVGRPVPDLSALRRYLIAGGRAVILEQGDLAPFGLDLRLLDVPSTMTFPLRKDHPLLAGLTADDLKFWGHDNWVTRYEISRPARGGAKAVTVSGGESWLGNAPVVDVPVGRGRAIVIQALAGTKRDIEPAASRLIQNAVDLVAAPAGGPASVEVHADDPRFVEAVRGLGVAVGTDRGGVVLLHGAPKDAKSVVAAALARKATVYWHAPTPEAFLSLRADLGAPGLRVRTARAGLTLLDRGHTLLDGVSREDLISTSATSGWTRNITMLPIASLAVLEADVASAYRAVPLDAATLNDVRRVDGVITFTRRGRVTVNLHVPTPGLYAVRARFDARGEQASPPAMVIDVNGENATWLTLAPGGASPLDLQLRLRAGENRVTFELSNGERWSDSHAVVFSSLEVSEVPCLPESVSVLTVPASLVTWTTASGSRVVVDNVAWTSEWPGIADPRRYASALLANLGATFTPPEPGTLEDTIPLPAFSLVGDSPYFSRSNERIAANSDCILEAEVDCLSPGSYTLRVRASGTPAGGVFPRLTLLLGDKALGRVELKSRSRAEYTTEPFALPAGKLKLRLVYDNDALINGEDRNLVINQVSLRRAP